MYVRVRICLYVCVNTYPHTFCVCAWIRTCACERARVRVCAYPCACLFVTLWLCVCCALCVCVCVFVCFLCVSVCVWVYAWIWALVHFVYALACVGVCARVMWILERPCFRQICFADFAYSHRSCHSLCMYVCVCKWCSQIAKILRKKIFYMETNMCIRMAQIPFFHPLILTFIFKVNTFGILLF